MRTNRTNFIKRKFLMVVSIITYVFLEALKMIFQPHISTNSHFKALFVASNITNVTGNKKNIK
jgi:hypothetical protein